MRLARREARTPAGTVKRWRTMAIRLAAAQDAEEAVGDGTERLLVMVAPGGHQPPVDLGEFRIDLAGGIGGEHEGALDAVVAALGDPLTGPLRTAAVGAAGKEAAEAADMPLGAEAFRRMEHAKQDRGEVLTDTGNGAQDIVGLELGVERIDAAVEVADGLDVGEHGVDLDGDLGLELGEVDMAAVQGARLSGGVAQAIDERVDEGPLRG